jgi:WD40 repeat protein
MKYPRNAEPVKHAVWMGVTSACLALFSPVSAQEPRLLSSFVGHSDEVRCVAISPDGKTLASGAENTIRLWDVASGKVQVVLPKAAVFGVVSLAFSPDGKTLASGTGGNKIKLWDVGTRMGATLLNKNSEYASPLVVFSPDGKALASGGQCIREIRLWDLGAGKQTATFQGHDAYGVKALAFQQDGKTLASVGHDGQIKLWDMATGINTGTHKTAAWTSAAAFNPDGKIAATAIWTVESIDGKNVVTDNSVKLWNVATGKEQASLKGHTEMVLAVVFSPDGKTLATGGEDHTIKLWDVAKGKEIATLQGHADKVLSLAFSNDGKMLASGSADKTIKLWDVAKTR